MRQLLFAWIMALLVGLALAACGDDDDNGTGVDGGTDAGANTDTDADSDSDSDSDSDDGMASIYGYVVSYDNERVEGVSVCFENSENTAACVPSDENGEYYLSGLLPEDQGYLQFEREAVRSQVWFSTPPGAIEANFYSESPEEHATLLENTGLDIDDTKGIFGVQMMHDDFSAVVGGTFALEPASGEGPLYASEDVQLEFDFDATSTNGTGVGYLFNVEPGDYTATAQTADSEDCVPWFGTAPVTPRVDADVTTFVIFSCPL